MNPFKTLRARIAVWITALLAIMLIAFGVFVYVSLAQGLYSAIDDSLRLGASQAIAAVNIENGAINFSDSIPDASTTDLRARGLTIRILTAAGQPIQSFGPYRTLPIDPASLQAAQSGQAAFSSGPATTPAETIRFYTAPINDNAHLVGILQIGQNLTAVQQTLNQLVIALMIGGSLLIGLAALGGYVLAARALAPIDHITRTAHHIAEGGEDLSARLNLPATDDEVGRLASTFDAMLAKLDESFQRERQFTADASHELRTPLAAMQAILSVIRERRRSPEDYEQALADLAEEADRLRSLTENLLRLTHNDRTSSFVRERLDLTWLLRNVIESMRPLAEAKSLTLTSVVPDGLTILGNDEDLIRLFVNLVDNAIKYTDHGTISLHAEISAASVKVSIVDTGRGIAAEHLPHIFDRFYRVDTARTTGGAGLGLAIALDIARAHDGRIEVSSTVGTGTQFTVFLP